MKFFITQRRTLLASGASLFLLGFLIPEAKLIPVDAATPNDWNKDTFWYEPWGTSGVHKGIDIFANKGTSVIAPVDMLVLYTGESSKGGKIIVGLGPKWRIHYFAHLDQISANLAFGMLSGSKLGTVGDTGNATGKQAHLHYSILSLVPLPWRIDNSTQGYKKAIYINPIEYFEAQ